MVLAISANLLAKDPPESLQKAAQTKLEASLQTLSELRERIRNERLPLAEQLRALELEVTQKQEQWEGLQTKANPYQESLSSLENSIAQRQSAALQQSQQLDAFLHFFKSTLPISEVKGTADLFDQWRQALAQPSQTELARDKPRFDLLQAALDRLKITEIPLLFPGDAVLPQGLLASGQLTRIGPLTYFLTDDGDMGGWITEDGLQARLIPFGGESTAMINDFIKGKSNHLPIALSPELFSSPTHPILSLFKHLSKGGVWIIPILVLGVIAGFIAILKLVQLYRIHRPNAPTLETIFQHIDAKDSNRSQRALEQLKGPVKDLMLLGYRRQNSPQDHIQDEMETYLSHYQPQLERWLPFLALTAAVAPLLGLLGTVSGMIKTFQGITIYGTGEAAPLASGISEALITTELGLLVAIPALILHALINRKVHGHLAYMEDIAAQWLNRAQPIKELRT